MKELTKDIAKKKILKHLDKWILEDENKKLDSKKKSNNSISFADVKDEYEDTFILTELEINSSYDCLNNDDQKAFLLAVYIKTALELWTVPNFKAGDSETEESTTLDKKGKKLFAQYMSIVNNLRNQSVIHAF